MGETYCLFGNYLLTYWRVYVVVICCRVYAVFLSYFRYSTLRDIYIIMYYTVHIMAYNFYVDKVLFTVQTMSVHFESFECYIYLSYVVTWCCVVICNYFLVTS